MVPTFTPPVRDDLPYGGRHPLWRFYLGRRGASVLKTDGVYTTVDFPTDTQVSSADVAYLGGHTYTISDAEAAALTAAGYTVT